MGFSKEIKDFLGAAEAGQKIIGSQDDRAYKRAHAEYFNAMAKKALDPNGIDNRLKEARIKALGSRGVDRNANLRALREEGQRLQNEQRRRAMQPQPDPNAITPPAPRTMDDSDASDTLPAGNQTAALDTGEEQDDTAPQQALAMGDEDEPEEVAATGGMIKPLRARGALPVRRFADGGVVDENFKAADAKLKLTPQEKALYQRHLTNLYGSGGVDNKDGSRSTLYQAVVGHGDKFYNIPTVWDGKILPTDEAEARANKEGIEKFPAYSSPDEADDRYMKMHDYMEKDTGKFLSNRPVQKFAVGGEVEDDDSDAVTPEEYATDPPDDADDENPPDDSPTDISAQSRKPAGPQYSPAAAHDAVREGLTYEAEQHGLTTPAAVPTSKQAAGARAYGKYQGAASPSQMEAVEKAIDSHGDLPPSRRTMASLAYVYEWNLKNGNPEGAKKAAAAMLGYHREVFDRYKHLSVVAAQHGDADGALKAAVAAYDHVPDGYSIKANKDADGNYDFSIVNEDTGQVKKSVAKPDEILSWATKGASSSFQDLILKSAGARGEEMRQKEEAKANAPKGPLKISDRKIAGEDIDTAFKAATEGSDLPKPVVDSLKSSAYQIYTVQPTNISSDDAANAALQLTAIDKSDPTKTDFKAAPAKINGVAGATVKFKNGRSMFVPAETLTSLMQIRKQRIDAATKELESAKGAAARTKENIDALLAPNPDRPGYHGALAAGRRAYATQGAPVSAPAAPAQALPVDEIQE